MKFQFSMTKTFQKHFLHIASAINDDWNDYKNADIELGKWYTLQIIQEPYESFVSMRAHVNKKACQNIF